MKRICSMILVLCIAFSMVACHSKAPDPIIPPTTPTVIPTEPTTEPTESTIPAPPTPATAKREGPFSKENVSEFITVLHAKYPNLAQDIQFRENNAYNDTPAGVFEETGVQIFSIESNLQSILLFENELYFLHLPCFNPAGLQVMTNAIPYDFDGDGVKDLIVSFWIETGGGYNNAVAVFNPVSKKVTQLYHEKKYTYDYTFYVIALEGDRKITHIVWRVDCKYGWGERKWLEENGYRYEDHELLQKEYVFIDIAGYIKTVDGSPTFVPYTE